jgi:hypothetical protein
MMKGFYPIWCNWIDHFIYQGSVGIKVNDDTRHYTRTYKGLRQDDPLSLIFF